MTTDYNFLKKLGQKIATARHNAGLTQEKVADAVDLHRTYIGFIEQGKRNPSIGNLQKISRELGISLSDLLKGL